MIKEENIKITFITSKDVYKLLSKQADFEDRSVSGMVRKIVNDYYNVKDNEG